MWINLRIFSKHEGTLDPSVNHEHYRSAHLKNEEKLTLHAVHLSRNQELILITLQHKDLRGVMTWLQSDKALSTKTLLWRSSLDCKWGDGCEFVSRFCRHLVFFLRTFRFTGVHMFYSKNMVWHFVFLLLLKQWNKCSPVNNTSIEYGGYLTVFGVKVLGHHDYFCS